MIPTGRGTTTVLIMLVIVLFANGLFQNIVQRSFDRAPTPAVPRPHAVDLHLE